MGRHRRICSDGNSWCLKCKTEQPSKSFCTDRSRWNGLFRYCNKCRVYKYRYDVRPRRIYEKLKERLSGGGAGLLMPLKDFESWYGFTVKKCEYCDLYDLSMDRALATGTTPKRFTIDRKDNRLGYVSDNICLSCWGCNYSKSNVFSHDEFKEIAQKYLKPKWQAKLVHLRVAQ